MLENRFLPYFSLGVVTSLCFLLSCFIAPGDLKNVMLAVGANGIFFLFVYFFYDIVKQKILKNELRHVHQHIRQHISTSIFNYLYFVKKVIYGYNLETNTIENIMGISKLRKPEISNQIKNQSYLGFQILKSSSEVKSLFQDISKDPVFLKFSSHLDSVDLIRISNNLTKLEYLFRDIGNFTSSAEKGIEYKIVDGKSLNPENDDKLLLLKLTGHDSRFVVYDSGYFEKSDHDALLNRYVLKPEVADIVSSIMHETLELMCKWLPRNDEVNYAGKYFRVIKGFFSERTEVKNYKDNIFVADIVETKKRI